MTTAKRYAIHVLKEWPLIVHLCACTAILWILWQPGLVTRPHKVYQPKTQHQAILLPATEHRGLTAHHLALTAQDVDEWKDADYLEFLVATYARRSVAASVVLTNDTGTCQFTGQAGPISDNGYLRVQKKMCDVESGEILTLTIETHTDGSLAVWARPTPKKQKKQADFIFNYDNKSFVPDMRYGSHRLNQIEVSRTSLYAELWQVDPTVWFYAATALLAFAGLLLRIKTPLTGRTIAAAFFCFCVGLSWIYAVAAPPFQAPDEADHVLSFGKITNIPQWNEDALRLANQGHYERIMCNVSEVFVSSDVGSPMDAGWPDHVMDVPTKKRSLLSHGYWQLLEMITPHQAGIGAKILAIRLANSGVIAIAILIIGLIGIKSPKHTFGAALAMLALPTLWFFGTHVSNYVFVVFSLLIAMIVIVNLRTQRSPLLVHLGFGLVLALYIAASRSAFVFLPFAFSLVFLHLAITAWQNPNKTMRAQGSSIAAAYLTFLPPLLTIFFLSGTAYLARITKDVGISYIALFLICLATAASPIIVTSLTIVASRLDIRKAASKLLVAGTWFTLVTGILLLFLPLVKHTPGIPNIERLTQNVDSLDYAIVVIKAFLQNWGFGGNDFFLIHSFWGGFGCPEPTLPLSLVQVMHSLGLGAFLFILARDLKAGNAPKLVWHLGVFFSLLFFLFVLAYSTASLRPPFNLHGRYMVGFYIVLIGYGFGNAWHSIKDKGAAIPKVFALATLWHSLILSHLIERYLG